MSIRCPTPDYIVMQFIHKRFLYSVKQVVLLQIQGFCMCYRFNMELFYSRCQTNLNDNIWLKVHSYGCQFKLLLAQTETSLIGVTITYAIFVNS